MSGRALALLLVVACALPVDAAEPVVVYVASFGVDARLKQDGGALTGAFCAELARDRRLDVVCEPDIRQMMDFDALRALAGTTAGESPIKRRLGTVTVLVDGEVRQGKHGLIFDVTVTDRDPSLEGDALNPAGERGGWVVRGIDNGMAGVAKRLPDVAARVASLALGPKAKGDAPPQPMRDD